MAGSTRRLAAVGAHLLPPTQSGTTGEADDDDAAPEQLLPALKTTLRDGAYKLRPLETADYPQLAALNAYGFGKTSTEPTLAWLRSVPPGRRWSLGAFTPGGQLASNVTAWSFTMRANGRPLALGGIAGVNTHPDHRRQGLLRAIMGGAFTQSRAAGQSCAALFASQAAIYRRFGFSMVTEERGYTIDTVDVAFTDGDAGGATVRQRSPADPGTVAALAGVYSAFIRDRVGYLERDDVAPPTWGLDEQARRAVAMGWDSEGGGPLHASPADGPVYVAVATSASGDLSGYCVFTLSDMHATDHPTRGQQLRVRELIWLDPDAYRSLWSYLGRHDLVGRIVWQNVPADDPAPDLLMEPRLLRTTVGEGMWLRVTDVGAALRGRGWDVGGVELAIGVTGDTLIPENNGLWRLSIDAALKAAVTHEPESAVGGCDVVLDVAALAALFAGYKTSTALALAGLARGNAAALRGVDHAFATRSAAHCLDHF
jgi:predicted acetyltransferase